jgi:hypothetical protein
MTVWPARELAAARPVPADTLAYTSRTTASYVHASLEAITDQVLPADSADNSMGQLDFWPHKGRTEWIQFEWDRQHEVSAVQVYWFDDSHRGGCKLPKSWRLLFRDEAGAFKPVASASSYGIEKDTFNTVRFAPVETDALRIEVELRDDWSAGVQEVVIE